MKDNAIELSSNEIPVFLGDDNKIRSRLLNHVLRAFGYQAFPCENVNQFVEQLKNLTTPAILVLQDQWLYNDSINILLKSATIPFKTLLLKDSRQDIPKSRLESIHKVFDRHQSPEAFCELISQFNEELIAQSRPEEKSLILLVDDSPFVQKMNRKTLENAGFEVITADNGVEGFESATTNPVDLIVSDVEMPLMNGYQMCRALKSHPQTAHIPIIMSTTLNDAKDRFWGIKTGADSYLVKGFEPHELIDTTNTLLKRYRHIRNKDKSDKQSQLNVIELVNQLLDRELFKITIVNEIRSFSDNLTDFDVTLNLIMNFMRQIIDFDAAFMLLPQENICCISSNIDLSENQQTQLYGRMSSLLHDMNLDSKWVGDECCRKIKLNTSDEDYQSPNSLESILYSQIELDGDNRPASSFIIGALSGKRKAYPPGLQEIIDLFCSETRIVLENVLLVHNLDTALNKNERLQSLLRNYLSKSTWEEAVEQIDKGEDLLLEREKEYTVLFSDICGFTTLSERFNAQEIVELLNAHFSFFASIVHVFNGDVDKFIGDCIMAKFENPRDAIMASFAVQEKMLSGQHAGVQMGIEHFQVRIGLNTGTVVEGSIGSKERKDHTIIGDTVNTASRMESSCPKGSILITEMTYRHVKDLVEVVHEDQIMVKGKAEPVHVYEIKSKR
jgi:class 3 adenylate cyclase/DNA-binding response OmpR family regulator